MVAGYVRAYNYLIKTLEESLWIYLDFEQAFAK